MKKYSASAKLILGSLIFFYIALPVRGDGSKTANDYINDQNAAAKNTIGQEL
jgi:hypothetical protein